MKILILLALLVITVFAGRSYPLYKQCDSRWGGKLLGHGPATICKAGCLLSSVSMCLAGLKVKVDGKTADPATTNSWLLSHGGY